MSVSLSFCHFCLFIAEVPGAGASSIMSVVTEKAIVKKEELWDVVGTDKWKINNSLDNEYKPRPVHVIAREACAKVGDELPYCVFRGNCEHFANELRYGKAESRQVGGPVLHARLSLGAGVKNGKEVPFCKTKHKKTKFIKGVKKFVLVTHQW